MNRVHLSSKKIYKNPNIEEKNTQYKKEFHMKVSVSCPLIQLRRERIRQEAHCLMDTMSIN